MRRRRAKRWPNAFTIQQRRLLVESLEVRATPAVFFPAADLSDGASGSLREAITTANFNGVDDLINLSSGIYSLTMGGPGDDANFTGDLDITGADQTLTIRGAGASATWIRADVIDRVVHVLDDAHLVLEDLTITHGRTDQQFEFGGGIYNRGLLELNRVEVVDNFARFGGGLYTTTNSQLRVDSSTFTQNLADFGGGIAIGDTESVEIVNSTISGNRAVNRQTFPTLELVEQVSGLSNGVGVTNAGDGSDRLFITEQSGRLRVIENGSLQSAPFLDISSQVTSGGERGLLGLAFHPDYGTPGAAGEGKFYVYYSAPVAGANHKSVISEFSVSAGNPNLADPNSERVLLEINQPFGNHNGGDLQFGPDDGHLYIATGDGGSGGDPQDNAQNRGNLLGKILRLDVNGNNGPGGEYGIPSDNPFVGEAGVREEIFAYGLRNPFRMSFDDGPLGPLSPDRLFVGDVGQGDREEVDIVVSGGNYGWRIFEGTLPYDDSGRSPDHPPIDPIAEYGRSNGRSVIGGNVYRGSQFPELTETYLFADFFGRFYTLQEESSGFEFSEPTFSGVSPSSLSITDFGEDEAGEVYLLTFGRLYQVTAQSSNAGQGGGIYFSGIQTNIQSSTIANNSAAGGAGGVGGGSDGLSIHNTIIANNESFNTGDIGGRFTSEGYNLIGDSTGVMIEGDTTGNLLDVDPLLGPLADNGGPTRTHALLSGSQAIDSGDPAGLLATDQLGSLRPADGNDDGSAQADMGALEVQATAGTISLVTAKDNTLYEDATGALSNGAGQYLFAGRLGSLGNFELRRGLLAFDLASSLPTGATIVAATLTLNVSKANSGSLPVSLHRTLADWGEGTSNAPGVEGQGTAATADDATWLHTFSPDSQWSTAGGDFAASASATTQVAGVGSYQWSSPELIADLQAWLADPDSNFGWTVVGDESTNMSAKRLDTRESPAAGNRPTLSIEFTVPTLEGVVDRQTFYNNAPAFDADPQDPTAGDTAAIATDKQALLPGQTATFANYTGYSRGLNGVMVDIARLAQPILVDSSDFEFRVGNNDTPDTWSLAPAPEQIRIEPATTTGQADRIVITWPDGAIRNEWLEVTVKATAATGLSADDLFYFGNAVGETGDAPAGTQVDAIDFARIRANPSTFLQPATIENALDHNRDQRVNATDLLIVREGRTPLSGNLNLISPAVGGSLQAKSVLGFAARQNGSSDVVVGSEPKQSRLSADENLGEERHRAAILYALDQLRQESLVRKLAWLESEAEERESLAVDLVLGEEL